MWHIPETYFGTEAIADSAAAYILLLQVLYHSTFPTPLNLMEFRTIAGEHELVHLLDLLLPSHKLQCTAQTLTSHTGPLNESPHCRFFEIQVFLC